MATTIRQRYNLGAVSAATSRSLVMDAANGRALVTGNNLVVWVIQTVAAIRTYSISDGTNTYDISTIPQYSGTTSRQLLLAYAENITGGDKTITVTASASTTFTCGVFEVEGLKTSSSYGTHDVNEETASVTTHQCAASGNIDTSGAGLVVAVSVANASWGTYTANADYSVEISGTQAAVQYRIVTGATNDQNAEYTGTTARTSINVIGYWQEAAGAGSSVPVFYNHMQQQRMA